MRIWGTYEDARDGALWLLREFPTGELHRSFPMSIKRKIAECEGLSLGSKNDMKIILKKFQDYRNYYQQKLMTENPSYPFYGRNGFHHSEATYVSDRIKELNITRGRLEVQKHHAIKAQQDGFDSARYDRQWTESRIFEVEGQLETYRHRLGELAESEAA